MASRTDEQLSLLPQRGKSRTRDPKTSKDAAASLGALRPSQREVLQLFRRFGAMDDKTLIEVAKHEGTKQSDSSLRSRRSELSKPNMERIEEIVKSAMGEKYGIEMDDEEYYDLARENLRIEGYRSPLVDSGKRVQYGRTQGTVWKLAPGYEE